MLGSSQTESCVSVFQIIAAGRTYRLKVHTVLQETELPPFNSCTAVKENGAQLHQQEENFFIHCARLLVPVAAAGSSFTASLMAGVQQLPVYHKRFLRLWARSLISCRSAAMGKEQDLLVAVKNGDLLLAHKLLSKVKCNKTSEYKAKTETFSVFIRLLMLSLWLETFNCKKNLNIFTFLENWCCFFFLSLTS